MKKRGAVVTAVLACIDPRLQWPVNEFLEERGLKGKCFLITEFGGVHCLSPMGNEDVRRGVIKKLSLMYELGVRKLLLINHQDCMLYAGMFDYDRQENELHSDHLRKARLKLLKLFPEMEIEMFYALIDHRSDTVKKFEIIELEEEPAT